MAKRRGQSRNSKNHVATKRHVKAKQQYKDTVFRMLFRDKKNLLSLYNAVNQRNYTDENELEVVTLENAIYMGMKNDLAFIMDMNLYLYEHQSTYNPNIPLRDLFYIANEYQKLVVQKSLYSSALQKIPAPKFVVFYNGSKELADWSQLYLSSAYEYPVEDPDLELRVTVLNVNDGHNKDLMEQCHTLKEYAQYVARVRKYTSSKELSLEEAVECAVDECIHEGILAEFLTKNRAEVISMSIFEYDKDEEEKKLRKAEYEAGMESGKEIGKKDAFNNLIKKKLAKGKDVETIAEELEEDVTVIQKLIEGLGKSYLERKETRKTTMGAKNVFMQVIDKPRRKVIIKRGKTAAEYMKYCEEVGCDIWGVLVSMKSLCEEPVCLWLPKEYIKPGTSEYVQGVEVSEDYNGEIPEGFDMIELPATQYLMFQGEPFEEEDYEQAIAEIWESEKKYDPSIIGYQWDSSNPRIQLEPIGARGYIELLPIRPKIGTVI